MVFPSLWEGLPLTLLEAMAARRAVVASDLPGHAEVIEDGKTGVLAPAGDPERFARQVLDLIADPRRRETLGANARAHVEHRHTVDSMVEATAALYRSALEQ
jgi:glycosyltransferase involved in cell wall biosynthesis